MGSTTSIAFAAFVVSINRSLSSTSHALSLSHKRILTHHTYEPSSRLHRQTAAMLTMLRASWLPSGVGIGLYKKARSSPAVELEPSSNSVFQWVLKNRQATRLQTVRYNPVVRTITSRSSVRRLARSSPTAFGVQGAATVPHSTFGMPKNTPVSGKPLRSQEVGQRPARSC